MMLLTHNEVQYIRDVIKEALESSELEDVQDELEECLAMLEEVL